VSLASEGARALAEVYALMVWYHHEDTAEERTMPLRGSGCRMAGLVRHHARHALHCHLLHVSRVTIMCKGCGRTFEEVQQWPEMTPGEKRATWQRITLHADAWRFNRYAERAIEGSADSDVGCVPPSDDGETG
jgi:predicted Fe-S protein YdhL (DUF1289 family)